MCRTEPKDLKAGQFKFFSGQPKGLFLFFSYEVVTEISERTMSGYIRTYTRFCMSVAVWMPSHCLESKNP